MADSTFTFRVDDHLKAAFADVAAAQERTAAELLRVLMRDAVNHSHESWQHDAWFRAEVERGIQDADDPAVERISHDVVLSEWRQQERVRLERRGSRP